MGIDIKVPDSVDHAAENLTGPLTKAAGNTFGDLWFLALGGISHRADLRRAKYAHELQVFQANLAQKISCIPEEKLVEPDTQIIIGALSDSQYCVENEDLRSMFENLIASSLNADTANFVHPSFSSIIRRLSSVDARNLQLFTKTRAFPVAKYRLIRKDSGGADAISDVFLANDQVQDITTQATSVSCLAALGLLKIDYSTQMIAEGKYSAFYDTYEYKALSEHYKSPTLRTLVHHCNVLTKYGFLRPSGSPLFSEGTENVPGLENTPVFQKLFKAFEIYQKVEIVRGEVDITPLGDQMLRVCC